MRLVQAKVLVAAAILLIAGAAHATHFESLTGTADCNGWQAEGSIYFASQVVEVTMSYVIELSQDGVVIASASDTFVVSTGTPFTHVPFTASGVWGMDLCGTYTVSGLFTMTYPGVTETQSFSDDVVCDCPPPPPPPPSGCFLTPGYWKNHDWPVDSLMFAGAEMSRDDLMVILWTPVRGDATVILAHHLIAAKLNVISGADDGIQDTIDAADAFLMDNPLFSRPSGALKQEATELKDTLAAYNEQGCDEDSTGDPDKSVMTQEVQTWSNLKTLYR